MTLHDQTTDRAPGHLTRIARIVARAGFMLTVLGALSLLLSGVGSRWYWWDFRTGFVIFRWTLYGGLVAVVVALAGLVLALLARAGRTALLSLVTLALLAAVAAVPVTHLRAAGRVPPIHDITTDLDDPPWLPSSARAIPISRPAASRRRRTACSRARSTSPEASAGRSWPRRPRRAAWRPPTAPAGSASATTSWSASGRTAPARGRPPAPRAPPRDRSAAGCGRGRTRAGSRTAWTRPGAGRPRRGWPSPRDAAPP